ncbi:MAG: hypothetical protein WDN28_25355 [Chthoniobacter sp.]
MAAVLRARSFTAVPILKAPEAPVSFDAELLLMGVLTEPKEFAMLKSPGRKIDRVPELAAALAALVPKFQPMTTSAKICPGGRASPDRALLEREESRA